MTTLAKSTLRQGMHARRGDLTAEQRQFAGAALAMNARLLLSLAPAGSPIISSYWAIGSELNPSGLEGALVAEGAQLCLPVMVAKMKPLLFRRYYHGDPLRERAWGIREPMETAEIVTPDILLVPLLAVEPNGARLGYGGGFYDRTLSELRRSRTIVAVGVAYEEQVVAEVPTEAYDELLDWVLTPTGLNRCAGRPPQLGKSETK